MLHTRVTNSLRQGKTSDTPARSVDYYGIRIVVLERQLPDRMGDDDCVTSRCFRKTLCTLNVQTLRRTSNM
jgi:hypothetical protein